MKTNTAKDSPDQQRVRGVLDEIHALLDKHELGAVVLVNSKESAAWELVVRDWGAFRILEDGSFLLHLQIKKADPEATKRTERTLAFVGSIRDMSRDATELFGRMFRQVKQELAKSGNEVEHAVFPGGVRLDPESGKKS